MEHDHNEFKVETCDKCGMPIAKDTEVEDGRYVFCGRSCKDAYWANHTDSPQQAIPVSESHGQNRTTLP
jgi:hypothetical protein